MVCRDDITYIPKTQVTFSLMVDLQFEGSNQRVEIRATKPSLDWATELHQIQLKSYLTLIYTS